MMLKRRCSDAGLCELLRGAARWCESFDTVALCFHAFTNDGQRSRLAGACYAIKSNNLFASHEDFIDCGKLRLAQLWMHIFRVDAPGWRYEHGSFILVFIALLHKAHDLPLQANHLGCCVLWRCSSIGALNLAELSIPHTLIEFLS